jgi:hypothetical protein
VDCEFGGKINDLSAIMLYISRNKLLRSSNPDKAKNVIANAKRTVENLEIKFRHHKYFTAKVSEKTE